ncbi:MAG: hypothetical protein KGI75_27880 [Rhizobiaceae bacterium]|nr:hypothetical protein [Rhizobiaceae bacterium]
MSLLNLRRDRNGNIAVTAALCAPLILYVLSLGIDYGALTLQQRTLQDQADIAAIVAASDPGNAQANVLANFQQNGMNIAIRTADGYTSNAGQQQLSIADAAKDFDAIATITPGTYVADPSVDIDKRFVAGAQPYDAAKVSIRQTGNLYFATSFADAPTLQATGTASTQKIAAFSIGSRLASLNGGLLNSLLGGLLGTTISLKVMDYNALLSANVNLLSIIDSLSTDLNLTAANYSDVLDTQITMSQFLNSVGKSTGLSGTAAAAIKTVQNAANTTQVKFRLGDILDLGPLQQRVIGTGSHLSVTADVLDLISAAAMAANQNKQIGVNVGASIPGLASVTVTLAIGEPPQGTPATAVGAVGSLVRTAQTRLQINTQVTGLSAIAGLTLQVPIYLEIAYAEGKLSNITCLGGGAQNANVSVDAVPGIADLELGTVDTSSFANFSSKPRVTDAALVSSALLKVTGSSSVKITNMSKSTLTFSPSEISSGTVKSISTKDTLTSTVTSLLSNASLNVQILGIGIGTNAAIQSAVAQTLSGVTSPLDTVLYNTLLLLGIKVGEADVRVTDVRCQQPVLVQ